MAANSDVVQRKGFGAKPFNIFNVSRFCGVFPFYLSGEIHSSRLLLAMSTIPLLLPYASLFFLDSHMRLHSKMIPDKFYFVSHIFPFICLYTVPPLSVFSLKCKFDKLYKALELLKSVEDTINVEVQVGNCYFILLVILLLIPINITETYLYGDEYRSDPCYCAAYLTLFLGVLIIMQFTAFLKVIRTHYEYLTRTLDIDKAQIWLNCHEQLGFCCSFLTETYSPQLMLVITSSFVYVIFHTYFIVLSHRDTSSGTRELDTYVYVYWIIFFTFITWYITYSCRITKLEAKNFDKLLYHLIINDNTRILLRNKRILLHFKAKRKEEFSAMGFFNFDYPLLCSMVSSATTYIVILVQFS